MLTGKGYFIWNLTRTEGGDPNKFVQMCKLADIKHVLFKLADGPYQFNGSLTPSQPVDLTPPFVSACHAAGIQVGGWQYVYGYLPTDEAVMAAKRCKEFGITHFLIDAEKEMKGNPTAARVYCEKLRQLMPTATLGLSSYRFPDLHKELPWDVYAKFVDFMQPQVYWVSSTNPGYQLQKSYSYYHSHWPSTPYVPTGLAYGTATPTQEVEFLDTCKALGLTAVNFWSWEHARIYLPECFNAIGNYDWPDPNEPPAPENHTVGTVTVDSTTGLWLRGGPSTADYKITLMPYKSVLYVLSAHKGWLLVETQAGIKGYCSSAYVAQLTPVKE